MMVHRLQTFLTLKRRMTPRVLGTVFGALALTGCAVVPQGSRPAPPPASKPRPSTPRPALPAPTPAPKPTPAPTSAPTPATAGPAPAIAAGVIPGPALDTLLPQDDGRTVLALRAFKASCAVLQRRTDGSGLTNGADWQPACAAAASWSESDARNFFLRNFEAVQVGDGKTYVTGYFEPEIAGCRVKHMPMIPLRSSSSRSRARAGCAARRRTMRIGYETGRTAATIPASAR
jgi:membrane-bound lytic murein transglycosylase A